jgi:hypothetical protein
MRFMIIVQASEADAYPKDLGDAGMLVDGSGLQPWSQGPAIEGMREMGIGGEASS